MDEPMSLQSPERGAFDTNVMMVDNDCDIAINGPPSSPFVSHLEHDDQENVAPSAIPAQRKPFVDFTDHTPHSAIKISSDKRLVLKESAGSTKRSPMKNLMDDFELAARSEDIRKSSEKLSSDIHATVDLLDVAISSRFQQPSSPSEFARASPRNLVPQDSLLEDVIDQPRSRLSSRPITSFQDRALRDNEGLTVAMHLMVETQTETCGKIDTHVTTCDMPADQHGEVEDIDFEADAAEVVSADVDDTCFSTFSEMPGLDMTKFAFLKRSPNKAGLSDATPRACPRTTPSTMRRTERSPSPTRRCVHRENDTTNLLLDFTAQMESFTSSRRASPSRGRSSQIKSTTEPNLRTYLQNQRSPTKGATNDPATPGQNRQLLNLLDFELPPPPTPRSLPTVTIREMESVKSQFQSQISSLTASLSGKEAEVDSLTKAVADAERRAGEAQEMVRDERSAREYAEAQMSDWKTKGEEVQRILQQVQSELARMDAEREQLFRRVTEAEKRADDAENRSADLETKVIEAESKNVDMTTFINHEEGEDDKKIYSESECQAAIAEKVNEVARDLHTAYKAKHEKKIKALKENYQKKADERCKELRVQIIRLEQQVEEAEKKRDDTFSKVLPGDTSSANKSRCEGCGEGGKSLSAPASGPADFQQLEMQRAEIESFKAKLAGLQSELHSLRQSHSQLSEDLEAERVEKGELVAAAEQMLALCGEKMEELQQEDLRRSEVGTAPRTAPTPKQQRQAPAGHAMRNTGFLAGAPTAPRPGSALAGARPGDRLGTTSERGGGGLAKPSNLRAPGGFGFQGGAGVGLNRSTSAGKSRLLSNIEKMGGGRNQD